MAKCLLLLKVCQQSTERQDYAFNWTHEFAKRWSADYPYGSLEAVRPSTLALSTGFHYVASGGVSGATEPVWPTTSGGTVVDGSITWTAAAMANSSLKHRITTSVWTNDTGFALDTDTFVDAPALQASRVWVSGGVAGETYSAFVEVTTTTDSAVYWAELRVTIE